MLPRTAHFPTSSRNVHTILLCYHGEIKVREIVTVNATFFYFLTREVYLHCIADSTYLETYAYCKDHIAINKYGVTYLQSISTCPLYRQAPAWCVIKSHTSMSLAVTTESLYISRTTRVGAPFERHITYIQLCQLSLLQFFRLQVHMPSAYTERAGQVRIRKLTSAFNQWSHLRRITVKFGNDDAWSRSTAAGVVLQP